MQVPLQRLREGDTILIDGSGWAFQLCLQHRLELQGSYSLLDDQVRHGIVRLQEAGFNIKLFRDGAASKCKKFTAEKRKLARQAQ